jgi:hypothetical protein
MMDQVGQSYDVVLPPFQIIRRFGFSRYIVFPMYLDMLHIQVHSKSYISKKVKMSYNLEQREYMHKDIKDTFSQNVTMLCSIT